MACFWASILSSVVYHENCAPTLYISSISWSVYKLVKAYYSSSVLPIWTGRIWGEHAWESVVCENRNSVRKQNQENEEEDVMRCNRNRTRADRWGGHLIEQLSQIAWILLSVCWRMIKWRWREPVPDNCSRAIHLDCSAFSQSNCNHE